MVTALKRILNGNSTRRDRREVARKLATGQLNLNRNTLKAMAIAIQGSGLYLGTKERNQALLVEILLDE